MAGGERGGWGGFSTKFYMGRFRPEVQPLNPFTYHFWQKGYSFLYLLLIIDKCCFFQHTSFRTFLHPFFCCYKCTLWNMKEENHETRTFSRVFTICKPCLSLNVRLNDVLKPSLTSGKCKNVFGSALLQLISKRFFYAIYRPPRILKPPRLYASLTLNWCIRRCIMISRLTSDS